MKARFSNRSFPSAVNGTKQLFCLIMLCALVTPSWKVEAQTTRPFTNAVSKPQLSLEPPSENIWEHGVGEGFRSSTQSIGLSAGGTYGIATFGSREAHDLALVSLSYDRNDAVSRFEGQFDWRKLLKT